MTIRDIITAELKIPSKDLMTRINNGTIKLNDEPITKDDLVIEIKNYTQASEFIFKHIEFFNKVKFLSIDEIFISDIPYTQNYLKNYQLFRVSKKDIFVVELIESENIVEKIY